MSIRDRLTRKTWRVDDMDCLDGLKAMPDNSVDACVTDPPYGLSDHRPQDVVDCLTAWVNGQEYAPKKRGFMGRTWDSWVPGPEVWREVLRVLKPGGHALVFAGSRTQDLMGMALRLAGFEIRDTLMWMYGTGFPKSLNVSKGIDEALGMERAVIGENPSSRPNSKRKNAGGFDGHKGADESAGIQYRTVAGSDDAREWEGWGTAIKPAYEPILLVRKPLDGAVAQNVMAWGAGGLNVDGCRIVGENRPVMVRTMTVVAANSMSGTSTGATNSGESTNTGRWPANVLLSHLPECVQATSTEIGTRPLRCTGSQGIGHPRIRPGRKTCPCSNAPKDARSRCSMRRAGIVKAKLASRVNPSCPAQVTA